VGDDLDGAIITGNFWTFEVNQDELNIEWFNLFVSSQEFIKICENASSGTTNRKYLDEDKFLNYELLLPSKEEQDDIISRYRKQKLYLDSLVKEITYQEKTLDQLKNQILLEAVQGNLVEQDP